MVYGGQLGKLCVWRMDRGQKRGDIGPASTGLFKASSLKVATTNFKTIHFKWT